MRRSWLLLLVAAACPKVQTAVPQAPRLASLSADLDGDGQAERIELVASAEVMRAPEGPCTACHATLRVGEARVEVVVSWPRGATLVVEVIDIDAKDGRKELVVRQKAQEDEDPPWRFLVVRLDGKRLVPTELWGSSGYNTGELRAPGDGTLTTVWDDCPDRTTVRYRLIGGGALSEVGRETVRTHDPSECAG